MEMTYKTEGEYLIPDLEVPETPPIGKYGMLHRTYIKENKKPMYSRLMMSGELTEYLLEIDSRARTQVEQTIAEMMKTTEMPDKATDQMAWVGMMNNLKLAAEEIVMTELIYN